jgi:hypothetical protein
MNKLFLELLEELSSFETSLNPANKTKRLLTPSKFEQKAKVNLLLPDSEQKDNDFFETPSRKTYYNKMPTIAETVEPNISFNLKNSKKGERDTNEIDLHTSNKSYKN